jgi:hypothetical protein
LKEENAGLRHKAFHDETSLVERLLSGVFEPPAHVITRWWREVCKAFHPDKGGDEHTFQALSTAKDKLIALLPKKGKGE